MVQGRFTLSGQETGACMRCYK